MTARSYQAKLDEQLERIAGVSGNAQREAALALVAIESARLGGTIGTYGFAINGNFISLRTVRDASGRLQVDSVVRYADTRGSGDAYFFGCVDEPGHYLWERREGSDSLWRCKPPPDWGPLWYRLDGGYARNDEITVHLTSDDPLPAGWTVVTMNDYSVDGRQGSHATFVLEGRFDRASAIARVREEFPEICQRVLAMRGAL